MIILPRQVLDNKEIPHIVKAFLFSLNSFADRQGFARVRRFKIARRMGMSTRSVSRAIKYCVEMRFIRVKDNGFHRQRG